MLKAFAWNKDEFAYGKGKRPSSCHVVLRLRLRIPNSGFQEAGQDSGPLLTSEAATSAVSGGMYLVYYSDPRNPTNLIPPWVMSSYANRVSCQASHSSSVADKHTRQQ